MSEVGAVAENFLYISNSDVFSRHERIPKQNKCLSKSFELPNQEEKVRTFFTSTILIDGVDESRSIKGFDFLRRFKPIITCLSIINSLTAIISEFSIHIYCELHSHYDIHWGFIKSHQIMLK